MYLKDLEIAKQLQIVGLNYENIKQLIYFFRTDKINVKIGQQRP